MSLTRFLLSCAVLMCACAMSTHAAVNSGTVSSSNGFAFLGKFCYQEGDPAGTITLTLDVPSYMPTNGSTHNDIVLLAYDDESSSVHGSWSFLLSHWDSLSCAEKMVAAKNTNGSVADSTTIGSNGHAVLEWTAQPEQRTRPRYWFYAIAACEEGFNHVEYKVHFTQARQSAWNEEFGSNEAGMNSLYLAFFLFFTMLIVLNAKSVWDLKVKLSYLHPMIQLFSLVLFVEWLGLFVSFVHYASFAGNGEGVVALMKLGQILALVSRCLFMLLLLLLAKGWTISNETLTKKWAVVGVVAAYLMLAVFILIWSYTEEDSRRTAPTTAVEAMTIILNLIWLVFACWFVGEIFYCSYRKEQNPAKKSMYLKLGGIYSIWFFLPPLASLAVFSLDPWARERIVAFLTVTITTLAYSVLIFLFWPSRAEEYFSIATPDVMAGAGGDEDYRTL